jgi:hypothetical protein
MTAITPFRHLIVYPAMTRQLALAWSTPTPAAAPSPQTP